MGLRPNEAQDKLLRNIESVLEKMGIGGDKAGQIAQSIYDDPDIPLNPGNQEIGSETKEQSTFANAAKDVLGPGESLGSEDQKQANTFAGSIGQRDEWNKANTTKADDKILSSFTSKEGVPFSEDELWKFSENELSLMIEEATGKKYTDSYEIRDNALMLLDKAKKLTSRRR